MNLFERRLTKEELNGILKESIESTNTIQQSLPMRLYLMANKEHQRLIQRDTILAKMSERTRRKVTEVFIIDDKSAIIETMQKLFDDDEKKWFYIYHDGIIYTDVTDDFDHALIMLICARTGNLMNSDAPTLISRMLQIKD